MLVHLLRDYFVHLAPDERGNVDVGWARRNLEWLRANDPDTSPSSVSLREENTNGLEPSLFKQSQVFLVVSVVPINDK